MKDSFSFFDIFDFYSFFDEWVLCLFFVNSDFDFVSSFSVGVSLSLNLLKAITFQSFHLSIFLLAN